MGKLVYQWDHPLVGNRQDQIDGYRLSHTMIGSDTKPEIHINEVPWRRTGYLIRGLNPGTEYRIEIAALVHNKVRTVEGKTQSLRKATLLDAPKNIRFTQSFTTTLRFQWDAPDGNVTHYFVVLMDHDKVMLKKERTVKLQHEFVDLVEGNKYTVKIVAFNNGLKLESNPLVKDVEIQTSQPSSLDLRKYSPKVNEIIKPVKTLFQRNTLYASWNPPSVHVKGYTVKVIDTTDNNAVLPYHFGVNTRSVSLPHIHPGRVYVIEIRAQLGDNEESDPLRDTYETPPDAPVNLTAVASSDTTAKLKWLNPASLVQKYQVEYRRETDAIWKIVESEPVNDDLSSLGKQLRRYENLKELDDLKPGAKYLVRLTGIIKGRANKKTPSVETSFYTDIDQIQDFDAIEIGSEELTLNWRRPYADVTHYQLYVESIGEKDQFGHIKIPAMSSPGNTEEYKLENLKPASRYTLEVTPYYEMRTCAVENDHPRCSSGLKYYNTNLEKPKELTVEILTPNYVVITWPSVASATHYAVTIVKQNSTQTRSADVLPSSDPSGLCERFIKLDQDKLCYETRLDHSNKYTFRIQAIRSFNDDNIDDDYSDATLDTPDYSYSPSIVENSYENSYVNLAKYITNRISSPYQEITKRSPKVIQRPQKLDIKADETARDTISIEWDGRKVNVQQWSVKCVLVDGGRPIQAKVDGDIKRYTFTNLKPGGKYVIKVKGRSCATIDHHNAYNCLESKPSKKIYTLPMEKPKVEAIEINATSITLEWHLQKDYADKVEITFCTVRNKDCESNTVNAHDGSWTKNGLTELTKYIFKVRSVCVMNGGAHCHTKSVSTKSAENRLEVSTKAMAPKRLMLTERYPSLVKIRWSYDDNDGTPNEAAGIWIIKTGNSGSMPTRPNSISDKLLDSCRNAGRQEQGTVATKDGVTCGYIEITRDTTYDKNANGAELDDLIPDSQYQIRVARIHRDKNNKITAVSTPLKLVLETPPKSVQQCFDMRTGAYTDQYETKNFNDLVPASDRKSGVLSCLCVGENKGEWKCCLGGDCQSLTELLNNA